MLTQKRLKEVLHYNKVTGVFTRINCTQNHLQFLDEETGYINKDGYVIIKIDCKNYKAHRLAFLYVEGYMPEKQIDHIDRTRHNNAYANLREVGSQCQSRNRNILCSNTSGVQGVSWYARLSKWQVKIKINKKTVYIGMYTDFAEATAHRYAVEQCVKWGTCDTQSTARSYLNSVLRPIW